MNIIYTATTKGYDRSPLKKHDEPGVELQVREAPDGVDGRLWNREQKIMAPPKSGLWSMYLDGSLSPKGHVGGLAETWLEAHDMAMFKHPWRTCAYDEIDECVQRKKISASQAEKARGTLLLAGFPKHFGLWAGGVIVRRSGCNSLQNYAAGAWWQLTQELPRDQIWFPFVLWRLAGSVKRLFTIDADIYKNKWFSFRRHGS